jgi:hypothetical protein
MVPMLVPEGRNVTVTGAVRGNEPVYGRVSDLNTPSTILPPVLVEVLEDEVVMGRDDVSTVELEGNELVTKEELADEELD